MIKIKGVITMNKFILKGYIGNIESEKTYTKISIATTRSYKNDNGEYETDWFNAVAFGGTAEFISKYFSKGDMILAEGNIQNNDYIDKEVINHHSFSFIINTVEFCGKSVEKSNNKNNAYRNNGYRNNR